MASDNDNHDHDADDEPRRFPLLVNKFGKTIQRQFERINSMIDESLEKSDAIFPFPYLCHHPTTISSSHIHSDNVNHTKKDARNGDKHIITSKDKDKAAIMNTTMETTNLSEDDNKKDQFSDFFPPSHPVAGANSASPTENNYMMDCTANNMNFASWLNSQQVNMSGIPYPEEEGEDPKLMPAILFSRDEFLEDEYISIAEQTHNTVHSKTLWTRRLHNHLAKMMVAWDNMASSNTSWKCWQQQQELTPHKDRTTSSNDSCRAVKDSSYTVDGKKLGDNNSIVRVAYNDVSSSLLSTEKRIQMENTSSSSSPTWNTNPFWDTYSEQDMVVSHKEKVQEPTNSSSPTSVAEDVFLFPQAQDAIFQDFAWQENTNNRRLDLPPGTTSTPTTASLSGLSSLVGEDITMMSVHSCTYSVSPIRVAVEPRRISTGKNQILREDATEEVFSSTDDDVFASAPFPSFEDNPMQTFFPSNTNSETTPPTLTNPDIFLEWDDSFPSIIMPLPLDENEDKNTYFSPTPLKNHSNEWNNFPKFPKDDNADVANRGGGSYNLCNSQDAMKKRTMIQRVRKEKNGICSKKNNSDIFRR